MSLDPPRPVFVALLVVISGLWGVLLADAFILGQSLPIWLFVAMLAVAAGLQYLVRYSCKDPMRARKLYGILFAVFFLFVIIGKLTEMMGLPAPFPDILRWIGVVVQMVAIIATGLVPAKVERVGEGAEQEDSESDVQSGAT